MSRQNGSSGHALRCRASRLVMCLLLLAGGLGQWKAVGQPPQQATVVEQATVVWSVGTPQESTEETKLYISGNIAALGRWKPDGLPMQRTDEGRFIAQLRVPIATELEYKFTLGSWERVEKSAQGLEIPNRRWRVDGDATIEIDIAAWAQPQPSRIITATGDLRSHDVPSQTLGSHRRITVWLPPNEEVPRPERLPTVYLLDGQNVFDSARAFMGREWCADETALQLARSGLRAILIAIDNSAERMNEYTPVPSLLHGIEVGGRADDYLRFLCEELKPWVDRRYPTRAEPEFTTIVGSSLGGLLVLHALSTRREVFGNGIAMSPSLLWGDATGKSIAKSWLPSSMDRPASRLWIDLGTLEGKSDTERQQLLDSAREIESILRNRGGTSLQVRLLSAKGAQHNEAAWAERLPQALRYAVFGELDNP